MDYKLKYYKYKAKYLKLKQKLTLVQVGGKLFQKKQILYIVATISQPKLKKISKEITDTIIGNNIKPYRAPHITLFNLIINAENDYSVIFQNEKFYDQIKNYYKEIIVNRLDPLILEAKPFPRDFSFPGFMPRYFIKNYKSLDPQKILDFRKKIFDLIEKYLGKTKITEFIDDRGAKYYIYSYRGKELFAESSYYDKWKPHLDFLNSFDIQKNNPKLYEELEQYYSGSDKVDVLVNRINHIPQEYLSEINMATQMRNMTYAIDHVLQKKFKV
ncbi:putative ORFan [Tupanvirus deep ocean]|uniref:ORFan n=2 Tax=Tupanvirus TaxID=2094720 RepID=A0AC62A8H4_9VIRU|nr:putative ORFan [Tupanvirus deep ocean]QKU34075.1 putative ORFan [Tupanvirus deep ocean]